MEKNKRKNDEKNRRRYWYFLLPLLIVLGLVITSRQSSPMPGRPGKVQYCEHQVSDDIQVRLAFTYYSLDPNIDPDTLRDERMAAFVPMVIPSVDYEITRDRGATWRRFWHLEHSDSPYSGNEGPWCRAFGFLDPDTFWLWSRSSITVTHDGGQTWIVQNGYEEWDTGGNMTIDSVEFTTKTEGQIVFVNWPDVLDPTLLTHDGGKTWTPDPQWTQSHNVGTPRP